MSARVEGWQERLIAWLALAARQPWRPGSQDCALFAAGAVLAMTGEDPAAPWRGRYHSLRGGLRLLRAAGFADHVAVVAGLFPEIPPAFAGPGDLAELAGADGLPALGVVQGEHVYVLRPAASGNAGGDCGGDCGGAGGGAAAGGIGLVPLTAARRAWRV